MVVLLAGFIIALGTVTAIAQPCPHDGDANQDGAVTPDDARLALHHFLAIVDPPLDACEQDKANVLDPDSSGITPADALCIFQRFLNLPSCLGPGDDHGNTPATATVVGPDSSTVGNLETAGDVDVFRIDVAADGTLTVGTSGSIDTVGTLFDSSGAMLTTDDDSGDERNFLLSLSLSAGTYFVEVAGFADAATGSYTLVSSFTPEGDGPPDTPPPPPPGLETFDLTGDWEGGWQFSLFPSSGTIAVTFNQAGNTLTGDIQVTGSPCLAFGTVEGSVNGTTVVIGGVFGPQDITHFTGTIDPGGNRISGTYEVEGGFCAGDQGTWELVRVE